MIIMKPVKVDDNNLESTNVALENPEWTAGTYDEGDIVVYDKYLYEALTTTSDQPDIGAAKDTPTWFKLGYSNRWRMFREGVDSVSTNAGSIEVELNLTSIASSVSLLGLTGTEATVTLTDSVEGVVYQSTHSLVDIGVGDWWEYYFTDYDRTDSIYINNLPPYSPSVLSVTLSGENVDPVSIGRLLYGIESDLGITLDTATSRIEDYSRRERDAFGNLTLIPRRTIKTVDYNVQVEPERVNGVQNAIRRLAATPAVFVGDSMYQETVVFGVFENFSIAINGYTVSEFSITVQEF